MALTIYCTVDDVKDRLSREGVELRRDDHPPDDDRFLTRASSKIDQYLRRGYDPSALSDSDWVLETAITLATFYLCTRRGNPAPGSVADDYDEALKDLEMIRKGEMDVPDISRRRQSCPTMSNVRVRLRPEPHSVVVPARSSKLGGAAERRRQRRDLSQLDSDFSRTW